MKLRNLLVGTVPLWLLQGQLIVASNICNPDLEDQDYRNPELQGTRPSGQALESPVASLGIALQ